MYRWVVLIVIWSVSVPILSDEIFIPDKIKAYYKQKMRRSNLAISESTFSALFALYPLLESAQAKQQHDRGLTFEKAKALYEQNGHKLRMRMPNGTMYNMGAIFALPKAKQRDAWNAWLTKSKQQAIETIPQGLSTIIAQWREAHPSKKWLYQKKDKAISPILETTLQRYHKQCLRDDEVACLRLGWNYHEGFTLKRDFKKAKTYFDKACKIKDNSGIGCYYLSEMYHMGYGGRRDPKKAKKYMVRACRLGYTKACHTPKRYFQR